MLVMIMAGGTGGHVYPALAVAKALLQNDHQVVWLGAVGGMETKVVTENKIDIAHVEVKGLRGNGMKGWLLAPFKVTQAVWQAIKIIRQQKPNVVLGMGGFVTGPGGVAAKLTGTPLVIHEQNAIAGLTNSLLKPLANKVLQAFPDTFKAAAITVGNPVRTEIEAVTVKEVSEQPLQILVVGGSLGAQALNEMMPKAMAMIDNVVVRHQTGRNKLTATQEAYQNAGVAKEKIILSEFIEDMAEAFAWADVVICRSGAMTVFEVAAAGKPALFVPYPHAVDDHQTANAAYLVEQGAAEIVQQDKLDADFLKNKIMQWLEDRDSLVACAHKAKAAYVPQATVKVMENCLEVAR